MDTFPSHIKKSFQSGIVFFATVAVLSITYATIGSTWISPGTLEVTTGSGLTASSWNSLLANFNNLNSRSVPTGAVMAFYGNICPAGWSTADGATSVKKTDGTSSTLDLRGEFIRGLDTAGVGTRGVDVTGRSLGSAQKGSLVMNTYTNTDTRNFSLLANGSISQNLFYDNAQVNSSNPNYGYTESIGTIGTAGWGNTVDPRFVGATRPRNIALLYCIKD